MRKVFIILSLFIIGLIVAAAVVWFNRANFAAHFLSRHLNRVPVTLQALEVSKKSASLDRLWIGNPPRSKTKTAFSAETIDVESDLNKILSDPLIIDEIRIENIFVGVEYYSPTKTNWNYILESKSKKKKKPRGYLIRKLVLENLSVEVTQPNGEVKRFPTISRLEFHNISDETGFPIEEIEKAIFNLMMQELFQKLNLDQLFEGLQNIPGSPLKYIPNPFK